MKSKCLDNACPHKPKCAIAQGQIKGKQVIKGFIDGSCKQFIKITKEIKK